MSTKTLIDRIAPYAQNWGRPALLDIIKRGQDNLFDYDSSSLRFVGSGNKGFPPYLTTVAGTYRYEIKTANLGETLQVNIGGTNYAVTSNQVIAVFVDATSHVYGQMMIGNSYVYRFGNPYCNNIKRIEMAAIPIRSFPGMETTPAYIDFLDDPGASTDKYFVEFTFRPPRLVSESIPLMIPTEFEDAIRDFVIGEVQMLKNGKLNEFQQRYEQYWKPLFRTKMSGGAQRFDGMTAPIPC